jgi:hypothetical protein
MGRGGDVVEESWEVLGILGVGENLSLFGFFQVLGLGAYGLWEAGKGLGIVCFAHGVWIF